MVINIMINTGKNSIDRVTNEMFTDNNPRKIAILRGLFSRKILYNVYANKATKNIVAMVVTVFMVANGIV